MTRGPARGGAIAEIATPLASRRGQIYRVSRNLVGYLYLAPALVLFGLFAWYPILRGIVLAFQRADLISTPQWNGLANFTYVVQDPVFFKAWGNTFALTGLVLLIGFVLPIVLAVAINEMKHGQWYFRLAFYIPAMLPPIVIALLWKWIYDPSQGLANAMLGLLGLGPQPWLQSPDQAMISIVLILVWGGTGFTMLIFLASLQDISAEQYEAAELDGANLFQRLRYITLPNIRVITLVLLILAIIGAMQTFVEPFAISNNGGPNNATVTVVLLMYRYAFEFNNVGAASALGLILFAVLTALSAGYLWLTKRLSRV